MTSFYVSLTGTDRNEIREGAKDHLVALRDSRLGCSTGDEPASDKCIRDVHDFEVNTGIFACCHGAPSNSGRSMRSEKLPTEMDLEAALRRREHRCALASILAPASLKSARKSNRDAIEPLQEGRSSGKACFPNRPLPSGTLEARELEDKNQAALLLLPETHLIHRGNEE